MAERFVSHFGHAFDRTARPVAVVSCYKSLEIARGALHKAGLDPHMMMVLAGPHRVDGSCGCLPRLGVHGA